MVKAELSYNPYLQETEIKFNGQPPRINSHVEKYLDKKLQVWIKKLPYIFRDEMNGYGFELEFTGTRLDCEELKKAFADAGVSEAQVRIFHKNELNDRDSKIEKVEMLLNWLEENPNDRYDFEKNGGNTMNSSTETMSSSFCMAGLRIQQYSRRGTSLLKM